MADSDARRAALIRQLNDQFRRSLTGGRILMTAGIAALPPHVRDRVMREVRKFTAFTTHNDPHREHDFGSFRLGTHHIFWKIDYYAPDMLHGSEDPTSEDPNICVRVLTVMKDVEY